MKYFALAFLGLMMVTNAHQISGFERSGSRIYMFDEHGKKYKTLSASTIGEVMGYSATFFVSRNGSWVYLWDRNGKKINTRSAR